MTNEFSNPSVNLLAQGKNLRKEGKDLREIRHASNINTYS
jgi:hypothetical protein